MKISQKYFIFPLILHSVDLKVERVSVLDEYDHPKLENGFTCGVMFQY